MENAVAIIFLLTIAIYFVPAIVAHYREHHNFGGILLLNIFAGWTLIGWVCALVWAGSNPPEVKTSSNSSQPVAEDKSDIADQIKRLHNLKEEGILTQEEFNIKKKALLDDG